MSFESILNSEFQIKEAEMANVNGGNVSTGRATVVTADGVHHSATDYLDSKDKLHYQW